MSKKHRLIYTIYPIATLIFLIAGVICLMISGPVDGSGFTQADRSDYAFADHGYTFIIAGVALSVIAFIQLAFRLKGSPLINAPRKPALFVYANLALLYVCAASIISTYIFFYRGYYDPQADSIGIPVFGTLIFFVLILGPVNVVTYVISRAYHAGTSPRVLRTITRKSFKTVTLSLIVLMCAGMFINALVRGYFEEVAFWLFTGVCVAYEWVATTEYHSETSLPRTHQNR